VEKEPIGYLYGQVAKEGETPTHTINGVDYIGEILPKLPKWDDKAYPYAVVFHALWGILVLCLSETPWVGTGEPHISVDATFGEETINASQAIQYTLIPESVEWKYDSVTDPVALGQRVGNRYGLYGAVWSNHDIISADGKTVLVAKSDPIPIYE
jgi:hypothetical protein